MGGGEEVASCQREGGVEGPVAKKHASCQKRTYTSAPKGDPPWSETKKGVLRMKRRSVSKVTNKKRGLNTWGETGHRQLERNRGKRVRNEKENESTTDGKILHNFTRTSRARQKLAGTPKENRKKEDGF